MEAYQSKHQFKGYIMQTAKIVQQFQNSGLTGCINTDVLNGLKANAIQFDGLEIVQTDLVNLAKKTWLSEEEFKLALNELEQMNKLAVFSDELLVLLN